MEEGGVKKCLSVSFFHPADPHHSIRPRRWPAHTYKILYNTQLMRNDVSLSLGICYGIAPSYACDV